MKRRFAAFLSVIVVVAVTRPMAAQVDPEYLVPKANPFTSADDLTRGEKLFKAQCSRCHGTKGEGGLGAVLAQPRLRHGTDDESLFTTIRKGVKDTEMPPADTMTSREIWQIAGYVRSLGHIPDQTVRGDAKHGEVLYRSKGTCNKCHVVAGEGGSLGPELSEIGARRGADQLRKTLLDPESTLPEGFLQLGLTTKDGHQITGIRINEDTFTIQVRDLSGRPYSFIKADLNELQRQTGRTPMPGFRQTLSTEELDDLVAYLVSLRGQR
jgi:putative heme-binding domain-containing protein